MHFREHVLERVRGSNFAVRVLCAFLIKSRSFEMTPNTCLWVPTPAKTHTLVFKMISATPHQYDTYVRFPLFTPFLACSDLDTQTLDNVALGNFHQNSKRKTEKRLTPHVCKVVVLTKLGNGPNTVSESTVSNTELSELFGAH